MLDFGSSSTPTAAAERVYEGTSENVQAAVSPSYPGTALRAGSSGSEVARVQTYLNALRGAQFPTLIQLNVDGRYGSATASAVMQYQALTGLTMDGVVGRATWDSLIGNYNTIFGGSADTFPGITLRPGMHSQDVQHMQQRLNQLALVYTAVNRQSEDSIYGDNLTAAARRFQRQFGLSADGILGRLSWNKIVAVYHSMTNGTPTPVTTAYPGTPLRTGSQGDDVRFVQSYLNGINGTAALTVDGNFGQGTQRAVVAFQARTGLTPDGVVGPATWRALVAAFNAALSAA